MQCLQRFCFVVRLFCIRKRDVKVCCIFTKAIPITGTIPLKSTVEEIGKSASLLPSIARQDIDSQNCTGWPLESHSNPISTDKEN